MKIVVGFLTTLITALGALFLYQNWNRSISLDAYGNSLSLDLQVWGLVHAEPLSISLFALIVFAVGIVIGTMLPSIFTILKRPS